MAMDSSIAAVSRSPMARLPSRAVPCMPSSRFLVKAVGTPKAIVDPVEARPLRPVHRKHARPALWACGPLVAYHCTAMSSDTKTRTRATRATVAAAVVHARPMTKATTIASKRGPSFLSSIRSASHLADRLLQAGRAATAIVNQVLGPTVGVREDVPTDDVLAVVEVRRAKAVV